MEEKAWEKENGREVRDWFAEDDFSLTTSTVVREKSSLRNEVNQIR